MSFQPSTPRCRAALLPCLLLAGWLAGTAGLRGQDAPSPAPSGTPEAAPVATEASPVPTPAATPNPATPALPAAATQTLYPAKGVPNIAAGSQGNGPATANLATTFLVLLGLCAGGYYLLRKQPHLVAGFKGGPRKLNVSESRSLGNRQFLVVVEYENERMLLGVTPGRIDYLCPLRIPVVGEGTVFPEPGGTKL